MSNRIIEIDGERFQEVELLIRQIAMVCENLTNSDDVNRRASGNLLTPIVNQLAEDLHVEVCSE